MQVRAERRRDWRSLTPEEREEVLAALRRRQQRQVEREALRLQPRPPRAGADAA
jgi:predicted Fe-S protein YdhL (DUF1289 family)